MWLWSWLLLLLPYFDFSQMPRKQCAGAGCAAGICLFSVCKARPRLCRMSTECDTAVIRHKRRTAHVSIHCLQNSLAKELHHYVIKKNRRNEEIALECELIATARLINDIYKSFLLGWARWFQPQCPSTPKISQKHTAIKVNLISGLFVKYFLLGNSLFNSLLVFNAQISWKA